MKNRINFGLLLLQGLSSKQVGEVFIQLDKQLKYIHSRDFYVDKINFFTIVLNEQETITFSQIYRIDDLSQKERIVKQNISELIKTMIGAYVHIFSRDSGLSLPINNTNYVEITKSNPNYLKDNYDSIKNAIPNEYLEEFFNRFVYDDETLYYNDYLNQINKNGNGKETSRKLVKTTVAGQYMGSEIDEKVAAYISTLTYPILAMCFIITSLMFCVIYNYLIGG